MKKIYLLLVNGLLITSAVGVTALTVAGCNDKKKDDKDKVKDEDVIKALKDFKTNALDIPYLGITKDTSSASAVAENLKKRLSERNATIFTEAVKKEITFGEEPLYPNNKQPVDVTVTYKKTKPITIKVKEKYGTEIVTNILKPYSEEGKALAIEYLGDDTAKKTTDTTLLGKVQKTLGKVAGLSKALIAQISITGPAEVNPGKTVSILCTYPGNHQGASINIRENGAPASKALAKLSSKTDAPLTLEHLGIEKEGGTATSLATYIKKALKNFSGREFTDEILKNITFDTTSLAPGRIVEVATTYSYKQGEKQLSELTYIYIREKYDVADVKEILKKYNDISTPVKLDFIKEGELKVNDPDVVEALKAKLQKDDKITSLTVAPMSFSSADTLSAGSATPIDVAVTFPGNNRSDDGTYNTEKVEIKVKEVAKT